MNVVLLVLDAVRADHLPCYGYTRPTTPNLAALAAAGVVFDNHFTPVLPAQPAFTSILSGAHPLTHRIVVEETDLFPNNRITWLPLLMRHHGWTTAAVDTTLDAKPWFARGCEYYVNPPRSAGAAAPSCSQINERAVEWLGSPAASRRPFFLTLRYQDLQPPWLPGEGRRGLFYEGDPTAANPGSMAAMHDKPQAGRWSASWLKDLRDSWPGAAGRRIEDAAFLVAQYDAQLRAVDDAVGELVAALRNSGRLDDTLLIVAGSHGLELAGEHGAWFDAHGLYDANLRVPLILHWPAGLPGGRRVASMTQHQDLVSTVLDAAGAALPASLPADMLEGRSLLPLARGQAVTSHWNQTLLACESTCQAKWAMRTAEYKLIVSREPDFYGKPPVELYDLLEDPGERRDIAAEQPVLTGKLLEKFDLRLAHMLKQRGLAHDPIRPGRLSRGKWMFKRLGKNYPPRDPRWRGRPAPKVDLPPQPRPVAAAAPRAAPLVQEA